MDTPNLPENDIEEITWQDDENRATLFLRSVFVLLSGALILGAVSHTSFSQPLLAVLYLLGMNVVLPVCIIWFFFGQGLRSVEWLTDQKYNAWNYGINFQDRKTHLRWSAGLFLLGIAPCLLAMLLLVTYNDGAVFLQLFTNIAQSLQRSFFFLCVVFLGGASFIWLIWGYLFFGIVQGFSKIPTFILLCVAFFTPVILTLPFTVFAGVLILFGPFLLLCFISCWKTKSIAPVLYSGFLLATASVLFLWTLVFRSIT